VLAQMTRGYVAWGLILLFAMLQGLCVTFWTVRLFIM